MVLPPNTPHTQSPEEETLGTKMSLERFYFCLKKSECRGGKKERKVEVTTSSRHSANSRIWGVLLSSFPDGFPFFSPTMRMYIFHYNDEETSYILGRKRRAKKRAEEINTTVMQLYNLGTKNTFILNNTWLSPNSPTRKTHRHC